MTNSQIESKNLSITIQRGAHNKENPYVMISKKMIRDKELSPKAKGVLCYLLSLPDTWQAHPRQVAESLGVGKDQIYKVLSELLKTGYALKKEIKGEKGRFGTTIYEFFEEKLPEELRFKEKSTVSGNPDTGSPDTGIQTISNIYYKENVPKELHNNTPLSPKDPKQEPSDSDVAAVAAEGVLKKSKCKEIKAPAKELSEKVIQFTEKIIEVCKKHQKFYRAPKDMQPFFESSRELIEENDFDPEELLKLFDWAASDTVQRGDFKGWQGVVCCNKLKGKPSNPAAILSYQLTNISSQFASKIAPKDRKFAPCSDDEKTLKKMEEWAKGAL